MPRAVSLIALAVSAVAMTFLPARVLLPSGDPAVGDEVLYSGPDGGVPSLWVVKDRKAEWGYYVIEHPGTGEVQGVSRWDFR